MLGHPQAQKNLHFLRAKGYSSTQVGAVSGDTLQRRSAEEEEASSVVSSATSTLGTAVEPSAAQVEEKWGAGHARNVAVR